MEGVKYSTEGIKYSMEGVKYSPEGLNIPRRCLKCLMF